jgi:hypothetical protein
MSFLNLEQLPFVGMSHDFVGEKEGEPFSAYITGNVVSLSLRTSARS